MPETDQDLVAQAKAGDRDALVEVFERHGPEARRTVVGRIPRRWRSLLSEDDVMQQTYMDAAHTIGRFEYRGDGCVVAWLARLAECNRLDAIKGLKARKRGGDRQRVEQLPGKSSVMALHELLATVSSTPSRHVARDEATGLLQEALGQLPRNYRRVIQLYDIEGKSIGEVAATLGRSEGAVFMLRARAHGRLREILGSPSEFFTDVS